MWTVWILPWDCPPSALTRRSCRRGPSSGFLLQWSSSPWPCNTRVRVHLSSCKSGAFGLWRGLFSDTEIQWLTLVCSEQWFPRGFWPDLPVLSEKRPIADWGKRLALLLCLDEHFGLICVGFVFNFFPTRGTAGISHARDTGIISI